MLYPPNQNKHRGRKWRNLDIYKSVRKCGQFNYPKDGEPRKTIDFERGRKTTKDGERQSSNDKERLKTDETATDMQRRRKMAQDNNAVVHVDRSNGHELTMGMRFKFSKSPMTNDSTHWRVLRKDARSTAFRSTSPHSRLAMQVGHINC